MRFPQNKYTDNLIFQALKEDIGRYDATTRALILPTLKGRAVIESRQAGVVAGLPLVERIYRILNPKVKAVILKPDGSPVKKGQILMRLSGPIDSLLIGERVSLNFLGHLSGIASLTKLFVKAVGTSKIAILDTRKTTPLLRRFEKYAVVCGGGVNHRMTLEEAIMIKDNHFGALGQDWQTLSAQLKRKRGKKDVIVEVDRLQDLENALSLNPTVILIDNFTPHQAKLAVKQIRARSKKVLIEASGNMTLRRVSQYSKTGVDRISIGALTHSAPQHDFSLVLSA